MILEKLRVMLITGGKWASILFPIKGKLTIKTGSIIVKLHMRDGRPKKHYIRSDEAARLSKPGPAIKRI
ncbi:hypothetical protein SS41_10715 [Enterobacter hormaechei subsp. xiangfangensis]|nr:hypothetical protein SS41_10715 [Enterobacter hormaechei subsp. xiangfangensis]OZP62699.1 hypothetical protein CIG26_11280 [Enterobacter hormaechei]